MCGIAGVYHYDDSERAADAASVAAMARAIAHRGPDGEGLFTDATVALAHRRLAIVDLTPSGKQPMTTPDGRFTIIYNGEFYDHARFREQLEAHGVVFRGTSDTETLLHLLAEKGPAALEDTAAIFGFALWDRRERKLLLARDHLGVKQLYFHDNGHRVVFASEIKALFAYPDVPRELDPEGLNQYLHFHNTLFERTFFKGVQQVRAGEHVSFGPRGASRQTYFRLTRFDDAPHDPVAETERLEELLSSVVRDQLMSDVPVGAFFSGGIDSSAVTAFAKRAGLRPRCFGVHFTDQGVIDERPFQEAAARALGVKLDLITLDGRSFPEDLANHLWYQDQPVIGSAMFPMYEVARLASRSVKVCVGGQAGDEIFAGYARYALVQPFRTFQGWLSARRAPRLPGLVAPRTSNLQKQLIDVRNVRRLMGALRHGFDWRARYFETFATISARTWRSVLDPSLVSRERCRALFDDVIDECASHDPVTKVLYWDVRTYLTGLFMQDDRMSMAHSLESRVPLADPRVVRHAFRVPSDLKIRGGSSKWILRSAVADVIPPTVLNRRKVGFDTPTTAWMQGMHRDYVRDTLLSSSARSRGWFNAANVEAMLDNPRSPQWADVVWKLLSLEQWARVFLDAPSASVARSAPIERRVEVR